MLRRNRVHIGGIVVMAVLAAVAAGCGSSDNSKSSSPATPSRATTSAGGSGLQETVDWIKRVDAGDVKPSKKFRIAWVKADANNPYTISEREGGVQAAAKYGATVKVFDAKFNPNTQAQQLQDALTQYDAGKFDGILIEPVAGQVICNPVRVALAKKVPIGIDNQPVCGDDGYTPGTTGYAGMQLQRYFDAHVENAFKSCTKACKAMVITGPVGFDVVTKLQAAVKKMGAKYPNVKVVANQPTDFSAQSAFKVTRDALTANPDISLVVSQWDDMMVGVTRGISQAGKTPGKDIRIYSNGADRSGTKLISSGDMNGSSVLMPVEEASYAMHQLLRFLVDGKKTDGTVWLGDAPAVKEGPGSIFITKDNVDTWKPEY
jgi:ABC-type sugar transport system substrate-binding protein